MDLISELRSCVSSGSRQIGFKLIGLDTQFQQNTFRGPIRGQNVLILIKFFYLQNVLLSLFSLPILHARFYEGNFLIQSPPIHPNIPPVQFLGNLLDACPSKTLLEVIGRTVSQENTIQVSFLHKCSRFSWCSAFNVVVAVTFRAIYSFRY